MNDARIYVKVVRSVLSWRQDVYREFFVFSQSDPWLFVIRTLLKPFSDWLVFTVIVD